MAAPQPAVQFPSEITHGELELHHKAGASIHYSLARGTEWDSSNVLIVFLNGLMSDKASWLPVMAGIIRQRKGTAAGIPSMLAYDRYGQGMTSDSDPQDKGREKGHGHDVADAALDLHALIAQVLRGRNHQIILVGNSIGCAIARIYSESNPPAAILFLDSIMANSNFDFWPNHDAPDFEKASIPADVAIETLREQRAKFMSIFRPDAPNKEGLSRRSLAKLLPRSDHPPLGDSGAGPWVTVVGHDFETFADESLKVGIPPLAI